MDNHSRICSADDETGVPVWMNTELFSLFRFDPVCLSRRLEWAENVEARTKRATAPKVCLRTDDDIQVESAIEID